MVPIPIAMHELKSDLSATIARVRAGEVFELTLHGRPVARVVGVPAPAPPGFARLVASGAAAWSGGKPRLRPPLVLAGPGKRVSEMVIEDRR
jgi:prevent-host-death family protein